MQLKSAAKSSNVIGLITKHADCGHDIRIIANKFVTYYYFSKLVPIDLLKMILVIDGVNERVLSVML